MAKKKTSKPLPTPASVEEDVARVQLRLDRNVAAGLHDLAARTGISLNQLINGAGQWLVQNGRPGIEPRKVNEEFRKGVEELPQEGVIYFGKPGISVKQTVTPSNQHEYPDDYEPGQQVWVHSEGMVFFTLDFTIRRVVKE